jgi:pimeloyl-ACP methyl ester carboxylesterase
MKSVIVLHGWGLSAGTFAPLQVLLEKKGYRVYVPDFPGFGKSKTPLTPVNLSFYVRFLHTFIQKHAITNPVLIGHSFGGRVALKYQYAYPGIVRALIFTGTPGFTPTARKRLIFFILLAKIGKGIASIPPFCFFQKSIRSWYYYLAGARDYYRAKGVMQDTFKNIVQEELSI